MDMSLDASRCSQVMVRTLRAMLREDGVAPLDELLKAALTGLEVLDASCLHRLLELFVLFSQPVLLVLLLLQLICCDMTFNAYFLFLFPPC